MLNDLSIVVNQFEGLSSFSAGLGRLSKFVERMESFQRSGGSDGSKSPFVLNDEQRARLNLERKATQRSLWDYVRYGTIGAPPSPPAAVVAVAAATEALVDAKAEEEAEADDVVKPLSDDVVGVVEPTAVEAPTEPRISNIELPGSQTVEHILRVDDLSLLTPDGNRQLFANVSYTVGPGEHLLIMGNSGTGKSSMLRAVAGLWTRGYGEVYRPLVRETMFLPQKPYCTLGSLRQQLVYPRTVEEYSRFNTDWNLIKALRTVQLGRLADRGVEGLDSEGLGG